MGGEDRGHQPTFVCTVLIVQTLQYTGNGMGLKR